MRTMILVVALALTISQASRGAEEFLKLKMRDGFELEACIATPADTKPPDIRRVVLLVQGSGPQSMDEDLTAITKDGQKNLVFKDLSDSLGERGLAVLRYHKRSYQSLLALGSDPKFRDSALFKAYATNPLAYFVDDLKELVGFAAKRFPGATVHLLGHSEGTYVALQVAHEVKTVSGVALVGFATSPLECLVHEQVVYRPMALFDDLDLDHDDGLDAKELAASSKIAASLRAQLKVIDLDADGVLSRIEFQAGNFSNVVMKPLVDPAWTVQEARYPRPATILEQAAFDVHFFHGLWDNQTPVYQTKAIELINRNVWKKPNLRFRYFAKHGHALDPRDRYDDLVFRPMAREARDAIATALSQQAGSARK